MKKLEYNLLAIITYPFYWILSKMLIWCFNHDVVDCGKDLEKGFEKNLKRSYALSIYFYTRPHYRKLREQVVNAYIRNRMNIR